MAESRQTILSDGEFFTLTDERNDFHFLAGRRIRVAAGSLETTEDQYDGDPARSDALSRVRFERLRSLDPDRKSSQWLPTLYYDRRFRFDPKLMSHTSYFVGPPPQVKVHFDALIDYSREDVVGQDGVSHRIYDAYLFVSDEWKCAIESVEPGKHQFFPHVVEFSGYTMRDHYIFRECAEVDCVNFDSIGSVEISTADKKKGHYMAGNPKGRGNLEGVEVRREAIEGRHWLRATGARWPFVSRQLAQKLLPLLPEALEAPKAVRFSPLTLV